MSSLRLSPGQCRSLPWVWGPQTTLGNSSPAISDTWPGQVRERGWAVLAVVAGPVASVPHAGRGACSERSPTFRRTTGSWWPGPCREAVRYPEGRRPGPGSPGPEGLHGGPGGSEAREGRLGASRDRAHLIQGYLTCRVSGQLTPSRGDSSGDGMLSVTVPMGERDQLARTTSSGPRPAAQTGRGDSELEGRGQPCGQRVGAGAASGRCGPGRSLEVGQKGGRGCQFSGPS